MKKLGTLTAVIALATAFGFAGAAMAVKPTRVTFESLCGTTVSVDTKVFKTTSRFIGDCTITVADGVDVSIQDSEITVAGDLIIQSPVEGSATAFDLTISDSAFVIGGTFDIDQDGGNLRVESNFLVLFDTGNEIFITSLTGDVNVQRNHFVIVDGSTSTYTIKFSSGGGAVNVRNNRWTDLATAVLKFDIDFIAGSGKEVSVKGNVFDQLQSADTVCIRAPSGTTFKSSNNFGAATVTDITSGTCPTGP